MVCSNWMLHETSGCVRMKRHRSSSSCDSCNTESPSTSFCSSMKYGSNPGTLVSVPKKSAEVFRKDLISAMKLPDSHHIVPEDYYVLSDPWRQEWEKGVQVPASPDNLPQPSVRVLTEQPEEVLFSRQTKWIQSQHPAEMGYVKILELAETMCRYDLDDMDLYWLEELNAELQEMGEGQAMADKLTMECAMEALERQCHDNMNRAIETEEGLGIEYDEDVVCDVCRSPDSEEGNDMVFCDKCNICVHQACYGIAKVPEGCWLCRTCVLGIDPQCLLCPKKGGAMKATRAGTKWAHISCALWIPEVSIACPERMEPITKVSHIPPSRWTLVCSLCKLKTGACIQCSVKSCVIPFHVTCALEHSLEMKTILDEADEVMFKSYCLKHSKPKVGEAHLSPAIHKPPTDMVKPSSRAQKLQQLEEEFFTLVRSEELTQDVGLPQHLLDFIFQYWKLKRKSNYNKALLPPQEEEDDDKIMQQPTEDSIQTRTRMFVLLRQDLERVRNLCYMVNRREKLKLSHSKVQEQIFNLQVALINHKLITGLPLSCPLETRMFQPPPRIMLKLKVPKVTLGNGKMSSKSNRALSLDRSSNLYKKGDGGWNCGTGQSHRVDHLNGLIPESGRPHGDSRVTCFSAVSVRPSGKPFAFQAALHSRSFNGAGKLERMRSHRSNGRAEKCSTKRDCSFQATGEQDGLLGTLHKSTMENFSRSFKEASGSLARTTQGLQAHNKLQRKGFTKEQVWPKTALEKQGGVPKLCQDNDGYCPDLELSDSDPESESRQHRVWEKGRVTVGVSKLRERGNEGSQGQQPGGPRTSVHR